jgi:photosystem II stability/assembly factor-like uncharacterized protein
VAGEGSSAVLVNRGRLYRSDDLESVRPLVAEVGDAAALAVASDGGIYLATGSGRFFRTAGQGQPEEIEAKGGPDEVLALAAAPPTLLAGGLTSGLWRSEDSGASWGRILGTPTRAVMFDRRGAGRSFIATAGGVLASEDGRQWEFTGLRDPVETLAQTPDSYFAITAERLVYQSADGVNWRPLVLER